MFMRGGRGGWVFRGGDGDGVGWNGMEWWWTRGRRLDCMV